MGNGSSDYMAGEDYTYDWLFSLKKSANETLHENRLPILPESSFVFWMSQGYQFCYYHLNKVDNNPAVYYYNE